MKKYFSLFVLVCLLGACAKHSAVSTTQNGGESSGGGGDGVLIDFNTYMMKADFIITNYGKDFFTQEKINLMHQYAKSVHYETTVEQLYHDYNDGRGPQPVSANNFPEYKNGEGLIRYNVDIFKNMSYVGRVWFALHELIELVGLKDPDYSLSKLVFKKDPRSQRHDILQDFDDSEMKPLTWEQIVINVALTRSNQFQATDAVVIENSCGPDYPNETSFFNDTGTGCKYKIQLYWYDQKVEVVNYYLFIGQKNKITITNLDD